MVIGAALFLLFQLAFWVAWQVWKRVHGIPPQPVRSPAQMANRLAAEEYAAHHPVAHSARLTRRTNRGRRMARPEDFENI